MFIFALVNEMNKSTYFILEMYFFALVILFNEKNTPFSELITNIIKLMQLSAVKESFLFCN